jgi:hypothetical protein
MSLLVPWLGVPLVLGLLGLGCGLLVERAAGRRIHGAVLVPLGVAAIVVVSQATTATDATADWTPVVAVVLALAGFWLGRARLRVTRPDPWAAAAAAGVFAVFAAPVVLSGSATFAGYNVSGDVSFQFIGIEYLLEQGRKMGVLPPSSYEFFAEVYYSRFYPAGAHTAAGTVTDLLGQNPAWTYHAFLSCLQACTALSLYSLVRSYVQARWVAGVMAFVAGQPAIALGYALQGQIKEVGAIAMIALVGALVAAWARSRERGVREVVPLGVAAAAVIAVIGWPGGAWLAPLLLACLIAAFRRRGRVDWAAGLKLGGAFALVAGVLVSTQYKALAFYFTPDTAFLASQGELGNLRHPISPYQVVGIWLSGDYRELPSQYLQPTFLLIGAALLSAALGLAWALRRWAWPVLLYVAVNVVVCAVLLRRGSPYADAKVFMIVSPGVLLGAMLGVPALLANGMRLAGVGLAAVIGGGVLLSNAFAYHEAGLAPRERLVELERLGERLAGKGPTLYTEFDEHAKFFLRDAQPEGVSEPFKRRGTALRPGLGPGPVFGFYYDLDALPVEYALAFDNIVLRRGPVTSRPPAPYRLTIRGRFYDVWQRAPGPPVPAVTEHLPLGERFQAGTVARCADVRARAARARADGQRLAYVARPEAPLLVPSAGPYPANWQPYAPDPFTLVPVGPGRIERFLYVPRRNRYDLWLQGSFRREFAVSVDGRRIGEVPALQNGPEQFGYAGSITLDAGNHLVTLERGGGSLAPGNGGLSSVGPLVMEPGRSASRSVRYADAADWRELCGQRLDWIERVSGGPAGEAVAAAPSTDAAG